MGNKESSPASPRNSSRLENEYDEEDEIPQEDTPPKPTPKPTKQGRMSKLSTQASRMSVKKRGTGDYGRMDISYEEEDSIVENFNSTKKDSVTLMGSNSSSELGYALNMEMNVKPPKHSMAKWYWLKAKWTTNAPGWKGPLQKGSVKPK
ncbi:unnamed protein product [Owenia fusiformis]|uniref:Uncharacterized protein n=1 Tax=Owenia fusiformis TaxID=6347 RepID=A0A8S4NJU9_OWEFU|nr:unnamed protein product [Owenia fusiformis]